MEKYLPKDEPVDPLSISQIIDQTDCLPTSSFDAKLKVISKQEWPYQDNTRQSNWPIIKQEPRDVWTPPNMPLTPPNSQPSSPTPLHEQIPVKQPLTPVTNRPRKTHAGCTTIKYNRKTNSDLEKRRIHRCQYPGKNLYYEIFVSVYISMAVVAKGFVVNNDVNYSRYHSELIDIFLLLF